ncbi:hypothetical protein C943_01443 [Mariniradius saccharolyticus AK6]|uniref:Uncharacterized protein n=1 Tax=Mariniradius saccharolyticus AK6 TaxID=1239962 RepID=M7Y4J6_9BACT|nr:hypothetical protein C943_01443 [Mariniradius saccharolyticus AK6]
MILFPLLLFFLSKKVTKKDKKVRSYQRTRPWPARRTFIPPRDLRKYFVQIQV